MADSLRAKAGTVHLPLYRCSLPSRHSVSTIHARTDADQKVQLVQEEDKGKQIQTAVKKSTTFLPSFAQLLCFTRPHAGFSMMHCTARESTKDATSVTKAKIQSEIES